MPKTEQRNNGD